MEKNQIKNLVSFFYEMGTLRKITRMHQQTFFANNPADNTSSHSFRTTIIGYFLAKELKVDADKVVKMCLLHDIEETRCGDQNWIHKRYVKIFEEEIRKGQLQELPNSEELLEISKEYQERKTPEAKVAKDADTLDELLLIKEYVLQGNKEAEEWLKGKDIYLNGMLTGLGKEVGKELLDQNPSYWWKNLWTSERR